MATPFGGELAPPPTIMPSPLARLVAAALSSTALALAPGCIGKNAAHCNFKPADHCPAAYPSRPHCSVCVADFDGCVEAPPAAGCEAEWLASASAAATTATDESGAATTDPTTTSGSAGPTTDDPDPTSSTTTTGDPTTTTTTVTGDPSTGDTTDTTDTTTSTTDTTTGEAVCGDGQLDPPEVCDGAMLDGNTCAKNPPWGGGTLTCSATCDFFDFSGCCLGAGTTCETLNDKCCQGLKCTLDGLLKYTCQP